MFTFVIGLLFLLFSAAVFFIGKRQFHVGLVSAVSGLVAVLGLILVIVSTAIYVNDNEGGVVIVKFGSDLPPGRIIATNGEKGPQSYILPPGWHFGYWPWIYDLESVPNMEIPTNNVGVVLAKDGQPLLRGEVYAQEWDSPLEMLDGDKFLSGEGRKGPQLTVLPPGQYRYNPRLFDIQVKPAVTVKIGEVVVVKANAGKLYEGEDIESVNGVPIVPNGYRGIWKNALTPNQYYLHPEAYELIHVRTTNRVYSYTNSSAESVSKADRPGDNHSINVRTKDGFEFPIDVRVAASISAENAPYVVAMIGGPDEDRNQDGFDTLEDIIILPSVRAVFRNGSEDHGALEYVNTRSEIETQSTELVAAELNEYKVKIHGVYIADIGLSETPEGKELLKTQTDKEVAKQEQSKWLEKTLAEESRAQSVEAATQADQQKQIVESSVKIEVARNEAEAAIEEARGKADAARQQIEALGGEDQYVLLKTLELISDQWSGDLPEVVVTGEGQLDTAVLSRFMQQLKTRVEAEAEVVVPNE